MYFNNRIHMDIPRYTKDSLTTKDKKVRYEQINGPIYIAGVKLYSKVQNTKISKASKEAASFISG